MKVLSIGNSFSQDAHRYIHQVAKSYGKEIVTVNLYIPGCSLERHYGTLTGEKVEINDFNDFDEEVSLEEKRIAVEAAQYALSSPHF